MKKINYKCCGKSYKKIDPEKFNAKCLKCKKNTMKNKSLRCDCDFEMNRLHKGCINPLNTMYVVESSNYMIGCKHLYDEVIEYYED